MSDREKPPRAIDIVEYWDKQPLIEVNGRYWNPMKDIGEPSCQACGCYNIEWDEFHKDNLNKKWECTGLEKAHIVPHCLSGENIPSNFLMLCRSCHFDFDTQIATDNRRKMLDVYNWLIERPTKLGSEIKSLIENFCRDNKISNKQLNRGRFLKSGIAEKVFDENQWLKIEIKQNERSEKYNPLAKNLEENKLALLEEYKDYYEVATDSQLCLDLGVYDWLKGFDK